MKKEKNPKRQCYFKEFVKHGYFVISLLLSTLAITFLALNGKYQIVDAVESVKNLLLYVCVALGVFVLFIIIYMLAKVRSSRLSVADSIGFATLLTGIGSVLFFTLYVRNFSQNGIIYIVLSGVMAVLGIAYLLLRLAFFKEHERRKIVYIKNTLTGYFSVIGQKYSFVSVVLTALIACSFMWLMLTPSFANYIVTSFLYNTTFTVILSVVAVLFVLYLAIEVSSKHVVPVDIILASGIIFFPVSVANSIILKAEFTSSLTFIAILFAVYLLLLIVRINCFDITVPEKHDKKRFPDVLLAFTVSALIVAGASIIVDSNGILGTFSQLGEKGTVHSISFFPMFILALAVAISTLFNLIISIANIRSKKLNGADILSDVSFISSMMAFVLLAIIPSYTLGAILGGIFIVNLAIFIARQRTLKSLK